MTDTQTFDLRGTGGLITKNRRKARIVFAALALVFAAFFVWIFLLALGPPGLSFHDSVQREVWLGFETTSGFMVALMTFAIWKMGPSATSVLVVDAGLEFTWGERRKDRVEWNQLAQGFVLLDYSVNPALVRFSGNLYEVRRRNRPASFLTEDAFQAIVKGATGHGLTVESSIPANPFWGWSKSRVTKFGPNPGTPS